MSNNVSIRKALLSGIVAANLPYPINWENRETIKNGEPYQPVNEPWLRVTIKIGDNQAETLDKQDRVVGIMQTDIFLPRGSGTMLAYEIADDLRQALPKNGGSLEYGAMKVKFISHSMSSAFEEANWYHQVFESKFYAFVDRTA